MRKLLFLLIAILCSLSSVHAQDQHTIDSLLTILNTNIDDTDKVDILLTIGEEYEEKQSKKAVEYYKKALEVAEKTNNLLYISNCYSYLGSIYEDGLTKYDTAEIYYIKCLSISKEILGEKHPDYALSLNNLASLYMTMGKYTEAEPLFLETKNIYKEVLGEMHPDYATSVNNLAGLYDLMGNYSAAEPLYLEAMNIRKKVLGNKSLDYAYSLNNLAGLYNDMGNYNKAALLFIEAKNIFSETLGEKHPDYATSISNLAVIYEAMGNYSAAEPLYIEAKNIRKEVLGEKTPSYATSLNNLGGLYLDMGNYTVAESLYIEAKNIRKEVLGEKHPSYARSLNNLASLYQEMSNYIAAEILFIEAMNIKKEVLGENNISYALSLNNIGALYQAMSDNKKAEPFYIENQNICMANIKQNFSFLSEKEKEDYIKTLSRNFNAFSSFAFNRYSINPLIAQNLFDITLATKGLLLSSSNSIRNEIYSSSDTALVNKYKKWQGLKENIGRYSQWSKAKLKEMNVNLDSLESLANTMEKELSLKSNAFSIERKDNEITWNQVQEKLGDKDVAVEFITYQPLNTKSKTKKSDTTIYCALVLRKEDKYPQMLTLCTDKELSALLEKTELYQTTAQVKGTNLKVNKYVNHETESQILYKLLWKPLDSLLTGREKIYVSLSGLLNKISFNTLQDDKKQLLLNKYNLCFVNSTRQLAIEELTKTDSGKTIVLFGGINYELDTTQIKSNVNTTNDIYASRALPSDTTRGNSWDYLQGTLTEVNNIDTIFSKNKWNTKVYTDTSATEKAFKSLSGKNSPSILHISTHGFFFPEPDSITYKTTRNTFKTMLNPLWRSGIILAGANYTWQCKPALPGMEDGVLTAYEVANSNLKNTDMVVLSACETGLGDIKTGEGVYGLQRAFQVAGAKAVIMSLWQVPDKETTELMTLFYESYILTKNKHDSFRMAQQIMAKKYAPYYWAAFVLVE